MQLKFMEITITNKINSIINKILKIIGFNKEKHNIYNLRNKYNILHINDYYKIRWNKITHDIIHNSIKLSKYYKKLVDITKNRNGLLIKTRYRESKYGDCISYNIMENIWNLLKKRRKGYTE